MSGQVWQKSPMNEWFIQKWRVKDLRLNRIITFREGRESSYFTSWNRWPSLDVPRFPASLLGRCWRWGALSNGGSLSEVLTWIKERGRDHWWKSPTFVDFRQADTENFGQGFHSVYRRKFSWGWDFRILDLRLGPIATLEGYTVGWKSMPDFRFLQKRGNSVWKFDSVTFECLIDLIEGFYLLLHTVIHRVFGDCPSMREPSEPARRRRRRAA